MLTEALEAPAAAARFLEHNTKTLMELGRRLRAAPPPVIITSARGSSDHASGYFKYLAEIGLGIPCASVGASVVSIYGGTLQVKGGVALTLSQSGQSPDIVAVQAAARAAGALTVAMVNVADSPAARNADIFLPLCAGPERSVAATKSFITSLVASAALVAHWMDDARLIAAVAALPERLHAATQIAWHDFDSHVAGACSLYVLGRGPAYPIALETALKLKETCGIHGEGFSPAEVMHGPLELVQPGFPVFVYAPPDASAATTAAAVARMRTAGASVLTCGAGGLPYAATGHEFLDPIAMMQTAYLAIERAARQAGRNPDQPRLLNKVTETR
jgi:glucosamine--fructose-6-phosphate aminotransferase (isomerizing)